MSHLANAGEAVLGAVVGGEAFALGTVGLAVADVTGPEASTLTLLTFWILAQEFG